MKLRTRVSSLLQEPTRSTVAIRLTKEDITGILRLYGLDEVNIPYYVKYIDQRYNTEQGKIENIIDEECALDYNRFRFYREMLTGEGA